MGIPYSSVIPRLVAMEGCFLEAWAAVSGFTVKLIVTSFIEGAKGVAKVSTSTPVGH